MKDLWKNDDLCQDLTNDLLSDEELSSLCAATVRVARRRRTMKRMQRGSLILILLFAGIWLVQRPRESVLVEKKVTPPQPAPPYKILHTERFEHVTKSGASKTYGEFFAEVEPVARFTSPPLPNYKRISDEQLLHFFEGKAVALVRLPGGGMELEFLDQPPSD